MTPASDEGNVGRMKNKPLRSRWRITSPDYTDRCRGKGHSWIYKFYSWFNYRIADCKNCSAEAQPLSVIDGRRLQGPR